MPFELVIDESFLKEVQEKSQTYCDVNPRYNTDGSPNPNDRILNASFGPGCKLKFTLEEKLVIGRHLINTKLQDEDFLKKRAELYKTIGDGFFSGKIPVEGCAPITYYIAGVSGAGAEITRDQLLQTKFEGEQSHKLNELLMEMASARDNAVKVNMGDIKRALPEYKAFLEGYGYKKGRMPDMAGKSEEEIVKTKQDFARVDEMAFRIVRSEVSALDQQFKAIASKNFDIVSGDTLTNVSLETFQTIAGNIQEAMDAGRAIKVIGVLGINSDEQTKAVFNAIRKSEKDLPGMDFVVSGDLEKPAILMYRGENRNWEVTQAGKALFEKINSRELGQ